MAVRTWQPAAVGLGMAATAAAAVLMLFIGERLEGTALDLLFRHVNPIRTDPRILHVDIDDGSLERIGRWPWHRDELADLVSTLDRLGAKAIAIDLILDAPEGERLDIPPGALHGADDDQIGRLSRENLVFPDLELAAAIRRAGDVFLSTHFEMRTRLQPQSVEAAAIEALRERPSTSAADLASRLRLPPDDASRLWMQARVVAALLQDFALDASGLAARINAEPNVVGRVLARAKRTAADQLVGAILAKQPEATDEAIATELMPRIGRDVDSPDGRELVAAAARHRALQLIRDRSPALDGPSALNAPVAVELIPPTALLASAAREVGFVVFSRDSDGHVRRMPLVADFGGRRLRQLGFALACFALGVPDDAIEIDARGRIRMSPPDGPGLELQIDNGGRLLIPWTATGPRWRENGDFRHVAAAAVLGPARDRRAIRDNERRIGVHMGELVATVKGAFAADYVDKCLELARLRQQAEWDELRRDALAVGTTAPPASAPVGGTTARIAELSGDVLAVQQECEAMVEMMQPSLAEATPQTPQEAEQIDAYRRAYNTLTQHIRRLREANSRLEQKITATESELAPIVRDKLVFVGYTATAEGDIVPTPIDPSLPGVIAHSNVLNAFLTGQFIRQPARWINVMLILAFGVAATFLTATRGPIVTLMAVVVAMIGFTALHAFVLFYHLQVWLMLVAPLTAMLVAWAAVTTFRQLTAERQKRFVQTQLAEFTDPALARRIAEDPAAAEALQRVENREVTCFFSDLQGFTSLAEQHESTRVQTILNTYLERMSEVLFQYEAFLNKFLGDGIMAFFNPTVNPQPDHARRACEAAVDSFAALDALQAELGDREEIYRQLRMRIGIASGIAGVGRFGSRRKADYTVIGDVANLAARLEPANKVFGTQLIVSGPTREAVRELYSWRYLAELQVKGKQVTVPVYELVGRAGSLTEDEKAYIQRFEAGVDLYKQARWDECIVQFTRILSRRVDDAGASSYIEACQQMKTFPPTEGWSGALTLLSK